VDDVERMRRLTEELENLITEDPHPAAGELDALSTRGLVELMNREDARVAGAVAEVLDEVTRAAELAAEALADGGSLYYVGAGTSGRLGVLDASECPPTFGSDPGQVVGIIAGGPPALVRSSEGLEDRAAAGWEDLDRAGASAGDVVVGITASTRTPYVLGALEGARRAGLRTVYLTCNPGGQEGVEADVTIHPVLGPEVIAGSTRLKAGTATKLILNMITTAAFVRKGKAYGNLMVDIRPVSDKLRARARRIVMLACGVDFEESDRALREADEEVKTAVVMLRTGIGPEQARQAVKRTGGDLREAVGGRPPAFTEEDGRVPTERTTDQPPAGADEMSKSVVHTDRAPEAIGPYSQAVKVDMGGGRSMLFSAGQIALDPGQMEIVEGGIEAQTRQVLSNLAAVLEAAGGSWEDVVKTTIFLDSMDDFQAVNGLYAEVVGEEPPARSTVAVDTLPMGVLVEIDVVAVIG